ncbi:MarR family transcriptional regulator [Georgfuchsia toluolica]|uniref:MarR family transcriptional regulator n=1 Tax=Georgfuchsia toluolica TaxID=424218 RepID=A0A916J700_9PROT|nr:MarR family transcriptional regulator [Georgfuchsia toluolica]CAG4885138.1 MarR family transcriptional regulator [Georgfuchsia toluolica]
MTKAKAVKTAKMRQNASSDNRHTSAADLGASQRRDMKLGFLIQDVSRTRRKAFDQLMKPLGVTRAQWWVLANLARQDGMTQVELADILEVGKASLGSIVERLESRGWVERQGDPIDKRIKRIYLTQKGQRLLEKMTIAERELNDLNIHRLTETDRNELVRLLSLISLTSRVMDRV